MQIYITSVFVDDQDKALDFYTNKLGFELKHDLPIGDGRHRWITLTGKGDPDGTELLLEPSDHPVVQPFKEALVLDGIPLTSFMVDDLEAEFERLGGLGVQFVQPPTQVGDVKMAVLDDTCGNLIQLVELPEEV